MTKEHRPVIGFILTSLTWQCMNLKDFNFKNILSFQGLLWLSWSLPKEECIYVWLQHQRDGVAYKWQCSIMWCCGRCGIQGNYYRWDRKFWISNIHETTEHKTYRNYLESVNVAILLFCFRFFDWNVSSKSFCFSHFLVKVYLIYNIILVLDALCGYLVFL